MEFKPPPPPPPPTPPRTFKSPVSKPASIKTPSPLKSPAEPTGGKSSTKSSPSDSLVSKSPVIPLLYSGSNHTSPSSSIGSSPVFETPPSRTRTPSVTTTPSKSDSPQIVYQSNPIINQKSKFLNIIILKN